MAYEGLWRVAVEHQPMRGGNRLFMWRRVSDTDNIAIVSPAEGLELVTYPRAANPPEHAGVFLPDDTWEALMHLAQPMGERAGELRAVRDALAVERGRIDDVLARSIPDRSGR